MEILNISAALPSAVDGVPLIGVKPNASLLQQLILLLHSLPLSPIVVTIVLLLLTWLYVQAFGVDIPQIVGIPEAPGAVPFYGHLKVLARDHASQFMRWADEKNWPVFQARMGNRRVVVLNTFEAAEEWIVKNAFATVDRPLFYTFHKIVSSTQGMTIGTSPWDESCKRRRTALGIYMNRPAIQKSAPMLDKETYAVVHDMYEKSNGGASEIEPGIFFKREALNMTLELCYGTRMDSIDSPLLREILSVVEKISTFRSTNSNPQDYIPLLRYLPGKRSKIALESRIRRDVWLDELLDTVRQTVERGIATTCISGGLLREAGVSKLSKAEIKSINVSLVSGGYETVSTTGVAGLGMLCTEEGQKMQRKAYDELMSVYTTPEEAWERSVVEEKSPFVVALVREMLRYYAALQLLPPRKTIRDFLWRGIKIPKGVTVIMNAQAINHDKSFYGSDAEEFRPERWLCDDSPRAPYHYSYGAGSRACPAIAITNRLLYATFVRLILAFKVTASETAKPNVHYVDYNRDTTAQSAIPKAYKLKLQPRGDGGLIRTCFESSQLDINVTG